MDDGVETFDGNLVKVVRTGIGMRLWTKLAIFSAGTFLLIGPWENFENKSALFSKTLSNISLNSSTYSNERES